MNLPVTDPLQTSSDEIFGISAVSRLTGISPHVLRIWERRYQVVDPHRSETKRREYSRKDVHRLSLVKALVDHGHSIRHVSQIETSQMEELLSEVTQADSSKITSDVETQITHTDPYLESARIVFVGTMGRDSLREAADGGPGLQIVGEFQNLDDFRASFKPGAADLVVIEVPALFEEQVLEIQKLVQDFKARRAVVIYRFAKDRVVEPLDKDLRLITAMRAPVNASELRLVCTADLRLSSSRKDSDAADASAATSASLIEEAVSESPDGIPLRQFTDDQLAKISRLSSVVQCECPQHLASLLSSLNAFEAYSAECENRNDADAKLHAYLHKATAGCRSEMETALHHVMEAENITVDD